MVGKALSVKIQKPIPIALGGFLIWGEMYEKTIAKS
jgi:hypothetical protein